MGQFQLLCVPRIQICNDGIPVTSAAGTPDLDWHEPDPNSDRATRILGWQKQKAKYI